MERYFNYTIKEDDKNAQEVAKALCAFKNCADFDDIECFAVDGCSFFGDYLTKRVYIDVMPKKTFADKEFTEYALAVCDELASLGFDAVISVYYDDDYSGAKIAF